MSRIDRNPYACAGHCKVWDLENLATFISQFDLVLCVAVLDDLVVHWHNVECDGHGPFLRQRKIQRVSFTGKRNGAIRRLLNLRVEFMDTCYPCAGDRLICTSDNASQAGGIMQWLQNR